MIYPPPDYDDHDNDPINFRGWAGALLVGLCMWVVIVMGLISLAKCAQAEGLSRETEIIDGWECDPTGACWPLDYTPVREVRMFFVENPDVMCPRVGESIGAKMIYACTIGPDLPLPIVIMPYDPPVWMVIHELGHVDGVTVHGMKKQLKGK